MTRRLSKPKISAHIPNELRLRPSANRFRPKMGCHERAYPTKPRPQNSSSRLLLEGTNITHWKTMVPGAESNHRHADFPSGDQGRTYFSMLSRHLILAANALAGF